MEDNTDNTVLITEKEKDLHNLLGVVKNESRKKRIDLNAKKTEWLL